MNTQVSAALAVGLIAIPVAAATGHPVASRTAPAVPSPGIPGLTINVTDGRGAATAGERLAYTVSVRDTGIAAAPHLKITQTLFPGLKFLSASGNGVATAGQVVLVHQRFRRAARGPSVSSPGSPGPRPGCCA